MPGSFAEGGAGNVKMPHRRQSAGNNFLFPPSLIKNRTSNAFEQSSLDASIDRMCENVCGMMSSGESCIARSVRSESEESRIDSELHNIAGGETRDAHKESGNGFPSKKSYENGGPRGKRLSSFEKKRRSSTGGSMDFSESAPAYSEVGPFLQKRARELISGDHHKRALEYALRAVKSFEISANEKPCLNLTMSLHVLAAIYARLGQHEQAIAVLQRSIQIPAGEEDEEEGDDHALARFAGHMQLGDTYSMVGQLENSIACYSSGLQIQISALGAMDPRVGETCRFLAEVHLQALQLDEAAELCKTALDIHRESGEDPPLEEIADRRLMGLICEIKGDHEAALEHLVMASTAIAFVGQVKEMASLDCSIGDAYLSLARYDEAIFSYRKALAALNSTGGESNLPTVAHALVRLADLYSRMGRFRESRSHCEEALQIYNKPGYGGGAAGDIAGGLAELAAVYESTAEHGEAIKLLKRALKLCDGSPISVAGIEAQIGVIYYAVGDFAEARRSLHSAIAKLRNCGEKQKQPLFLGIALNQMALACVQLSEIDTAASLFLEAKSIMEREHGLFHPETLEVYSNLAATYDAIGRWGEATRILEHVVCVREEKVGTASSELEGERRRLTELLKESGRVRNRKALTLNFLFAGDPVSENGGGAMTA